MAVIPPITIDHIDYAGADYRRAMSGLAFPGNTPGTVRTGALDPRALAATISGNEVLVGPGPVMIDAAGKGGYLTGLTAQLSAGTIVAADPTNPRLDRVVLEVLDPDNGSGGTERTARLRIVPGTPAALPGLPAQPALSYSIGDLSVPASGQGSPVFTDRRTFTAAAGAPVIMTKAERDLITPYPGMEIIRSDRDYWKQRYELSGWKFVGDPTRYITPAASFTNLSGTASRLIATAPVPTKPYAQRISVYGRLTVFCPSISSGIQAISVAVSARENNVTNAQSKSILSWTAGFSNLSQTAILDALDLLVPAGSDALARVWVQVTSGEVQTSVATPISTYQSLYADIRPADD
jgi:hypothetical protein